MVDAQTGQHDDHDAALAGVHVGRHAGSGRVGDARLDAAEAVFQELVRVLPTKLG